MLTRPPPTPIEVSGSGGAGGPVYRDLDDDAATGPEQEADVREVALTSTPLEEVLASPVEPVAVAPPAAVATPAAVEVEPDLHPGGRIDVPDEQEFAAQEQEQEQFRELFVGSDNASVTSRTPESLEGMPVKELRRLAEQRGITGAADMRKKEILAALRAQVAPTATLDLTKMGAVVDEAAVAEVTDLPSE